MQKQKWRLVLSVHPEPWLDLCPCTRGLAVTYENASRKSLGRSPAEWTPVMRIRAQQGWTGMIRIS